MSGYRFVWKFDLHPMPGTPVSVTLGDPRVVHVDVDLDGFHDVPVVWIEHTDDADDANARTLTLTYYATGAAIPAKAGEHVGSIVGRTAGLVWHVYCAVDDPQVTEVGS